MSRQSPPNPTINQLLRADLARERPIRFIEHVLRRDLDALAEMFAREEEVQGRWGDDDLCCKTPELAIQFN